MAELLTDQLDEDFTIVPLPTIGKHIRERGFDHTRLLARRLRQLNHCLSINACLVRGNNAVQVGASREARELQARTAYVAKQKLSPRVKYLLLDDV